MLHRVCSIRHIVIASSLLTLCACETKEPEPVAQRSSEQHATTPPGETRQQGTTAREPSQQVPQALRADPSQQRWLDLETRKKELMEELKLARDENSNAQGDEKRRARERMIALQVQLAQLSRYRKLPEPKNVREEWRQPYLVERGTDEADLVVRIGDIDNLGFGWPDGFDPLSGESTPRHAWPWQPETDDPAGTDRVMVVSGMRERKRARLDGYSNSTDRPYSEPQPITIRFSMDGVNVKGAALQLFVDDFQAPVFGNRFEVRLDGRTAPDLSASLNALSQTGPIGKLVTLQLLPEYNDLLEDGELVVSVDDPHTNVGDGFSFDFARLLINPKQWRYDGTVRGIARDKQSKQPLTGVLVSAGNVKQVETSEDGLFELTGVPAGMVVTTGTHPEYIDASDARDLRSSETVDIVLELQKNQNTSAALADQLQAEGKVDLYGIYFDLDKDTLKAESEPTLKQVRQLLLDRPTLKLIVAGHTDSEGGAEYNLDLSHRRAGSVVQWLSARNIDPNRLAPEGMGESQPVADNATPAGRALNRRVEIRDNERR